jgi:hypothetical protein
MREAPESLDWERPVEPDPEAATTLQPPGPDELIEGAEEIDLPPPPANGRRTR